jgi:hypothetical protein
MHKLVFSWGVVLELLVRRIKPEGGRTPLSGKTALGEKGKLAE